MTRSTAAQRMLPNRDHRNLVELRGYGVRGNSEIIDLRVFDLSYDGCGIESPARLVPGEEIKISVLGRGATNATVKWTDGRKAGRPDTSDSLIENAYSTTEIGPWRAGST